MAEADATPVFGVGEIEQFLIHEAALLDEWRLEEWLALMAEDSRYLVPPLDAPNADHRDTLFLIADDRRTLASRVRQLLSGTTWAENPRSRTRRLVTNVRLLEVTSGEARATANPATLYSTKDPEKARSHSASRPLPDDEPDHRECDDLR